MYINYICFVFFVPFCFVLFYFCFVLFCFLSGSIMYLKYLEILIGLVFSFSNMMIKGRSRPTFTWKVPKYIFWYPGIYFDKI